MYVADTKESKFIKKNADLINKAFGTSIAVNDEQLSMDAFRAVFDIYNSPEEFQNEFDLFNSELERVLKDGEFLKEIDGHYVFFNDANYDFLDFQVYGDFTDEETEKIMLWNLEENIFNTFFNTNKIHDAIERSFYDYDLKIEVIAHQNGDDMCIYFALPDLNAKIYSDFSKDGIKEAVEYMSDIAMERQASLDNKKMLSRMPFENVLKEESDYDK